MSEQIKMAACHPNHPLLSGEELIGLSNILTTLIEQCGASPALTDAVSAASDLGFHIRRFVAEADLASADRDIKAANLQLLVEKVLDFDAREQGDIDAVAFMDSVEKDWVEIVELARGLKQ